MADDCSTNQSVREENSQIDTLDGCRVEWREQNTGRAAIRNYLAQVAKGDWLLFIDSDMVILAAAKQAQKTAEKPIVKAEPIVKIEPVKAEPVAAPAPTSEQTPEQPKRKRQRIKIKRVEKIEIK